VSYSLAAAWGFGLVLLRTFGLFLGAPILGARTVPVRVRAGIAFTIAAAVWAAAGSPEVTPPQTLWPMATAVTSETALGLLAGLGARAFLQAAISAGQLASQAVGIGFGAMVDPTSGAESNGVSELVHLTAQAGAVALGIHREAIAWLARSTAAFPPGRDHSLAELATRVIWESTGAAALAVRLAFPILAAVSLGHFAMAVTGRMAPQLNLNNIGFSVSMLAGGGAFYLLAPSIADAVARMATAAFANS
jgi:flagellar biosynthetic protein FliR